MVSAFEENSFLGTGDFSQFFVMLIITEVQSELSI